MRSPFHLLLVLPLALTLSACPKGGLKIPDEYVLASLPVLNGIPGPIEVSRSRDGLVWSGPRVAVANGTPLRSPYPPGIGSNTDGYLLAIFGTDSKLRLYWSEDSLTWRFANTVKTPGFGEATFSQLGAHSRPTVRYDYALGDWVIAFRTRGVHLARMRPDSQSPGQFLNAWQMSVESSNAQSALSTHPSSVGLGNELTGEYEAVIGYLGNVVNASGGGVIPNGVLMAPWNLLGSWDPASQQVVLVNPNAIRSATDTTTGDLITSQSGPALHRALGDELFLTTKEANGRVRLFESDSEDFSRWKRLLETSSPTALGSAGPVMAGPDSALVVADASSAAGRVKTWVKDSQNRWIGESTLPLGSDGGVSLAFAKSKAAYKRVTFTFRSFMRLPGSGLAGPEDVTLRLYRRLSASSSLTVPISSALTQGVPLLETVEHNPQSGTSHPMTGKTFTFLLQPGEEFQLELQGAIGTYYFANITYDGERELFLNGTPSQLYSLGNRDPNGIQAQYQLISDVEIQKF